MLRAGPGSPQASPCEPCHAGAGHCLRFALWHALSNLGEIEQVLDYLGEAATLAEALDDQPRLGRVSAYMCRHFTAMGDYDGPVESDQHALAVAETLGDLALQVLAQHYLGVVYHILGDHRRAMGLLKEQCRVACRGSAP